MVQFNVDISTVLLQLELRLGTTKKIKIKFDFFKTKFSL